MPTLDDLDAWLRSREREHLEFKEANHTFDRVKLVRYCAAIANEGGGHLLLGVNDRIPRRVVGTGAYIELGEVKTDLLTRLHLRIDAHELAHPDGRVVVFSIPSRPIGRAIPVDGAYWMRSGESLVTMTPDQLGRIFHEDVLDFSAATCSAASLADLSTDAIAQFRRLWGARQPPRAMRTDEQLLEGAELLVEGRVTYAALILLGTRQALGRHLAQSEICFEYRNDETAIPYAQRVDLREGFLLIDDQLWHLVNARNTVHTFLDGLFRTEIAMINERAFREAVLNAVCHRDYRLQNSIFVRQWPSKLTITSPGGFPAGITEENILFRQLPRNRRLAEAFGRCGLVERSGQGADFLFETAVREGKTPLDYSGSDEFQVELTLHGRVDDEPFLRFLLQATRDVQQALGTNDLLVLNSIRREREIPLAAQSRITALIDLGLIERVGKRKLVLSRKYHKVIGKPGAYTRRAGLDRNTNKALLVKHIQENPGSKLGELCEVLPSLSDRQVQALLAELKKDRTIHSVGRTKGGRWFQGNSS
jgi:ATP-dependent DNA helicase RecG